MNKELRQKILEELKSLLSEQPESAIGLDLSKDEQQQILSSPAEVANFITTQNKSAYTNLDEATLALKALSTINSREKAVEFLAQWKKLNGEKAIQLNGNFFGSGKNTQKQIKDLGLKIQQMATGADSPSPSPSPVNTDVNIDKELSKFGFSDKPGSSAKFGLSFKCPNDTAANSIVAKYQRFVGANPDGKFGPETYQKGMAKEGAKLTSKWEEYKKDPEAANKLCAWLSDPKHPWAKLDGKVAFKKRKSVKKKINTSDNEKEVDQTIPQTPKSGPSSNQFGNRGVALPPIEESVDFYDRKKLNESKKLFNKLLKKLG